MQCSCTIDHYYDESVDLYFVKIVKARKEHKCYDCRSILDQLPQHYAAVTPEDIQRVANTYFKRDNNSSMYILPEQEK